MRWIEPPRIATTVLPGRWLCTVQVGRTRFVEVLALEGQSWNGSGVWRRHGGEKLSSREKVIAISYAPEPFSPPTTTKETP